MLDANAFLRTVSAVERETDAIFRQITEDLETEFAAIEQHVRRSGPRRSARLGPALTAGTIGIAATLAAGISNPVLGACCWLVTVLTVERLTR